jgi:sterol 3beta-glucosyltransferase
MRAQSNKNSISLLAAGTLGDVRPFVALGLGLAASGTAVRLVAPAQFEPLAARAGLAFAPLPVNPSDLLAASPAALTLREGPLAGLAATWRFLQEAQPIVARMLAAAWETCRKSRAIVVALPTMWGLDIAEALEVPPVIAPLQPLARTRFAPSVVLPLGRSLGPSANLLTQRLVELSLRCPWRGPLRRWRQHMLRLTPGGDPLAQAYTEGVPFVHGYSPWVAPPPPDWPPHHVAVGYWQLAEQELPPEKLRAFVERGEPPVYIGFGSMGAGDPRADARLALDALTLAGRRGVIVGGEETARLAAGRADVLVVPQAPHDWLLPRVAAAVHHGGAGTTGASLRAGAPTIVVPFAADQFFWGRRVAALGVGPPMIPRRALSPERLAEALQTATETPMFQRRAAALGELLRQERGVERAMAIIRAYAG